MGSICFVTDEIMPFTMGGIGAFIRNTLDFYAEKDEISVLYTGEKEIDHKIWNYRFPNAKLFCLYNFFDKKRDKWDNIKFEHPFMHRSMIIMECLRELGNFYKFQYIEFIDWGGLSFYTQQTKLAGLGFQNTIISVRLHTTDSILRRYEGRNCAYETTLLSDFERKSLADADLVISHLESVRDYVSNFYGLYPEWISRVKITKPPIYVSERAKCTITPDISKTNIAFTSKFQSVKRPDVFIKGVCLFLENHPEYMGSIVLTAMEPISGWTDLLKTMIPAGFKDRFVFAKNISQEERNNIISSSVVVFTNSYEAFCFAAHEAAIMGGYCLLNEKCIAFDNSSPWKDKSNCLKFDGSVNGLAECLGRAFTDNKLRLVPIKDIPDENPYWRSPALEYKDNTSNRSLAVLFIFDDLHMSNIRVFQKFFHTNQDVDEVVIALPPLDKINDDIFYESIVKLEENNDKIKIIALKTDVGRAAILNMAFAKINSDYVLYIPSGVDIMPGFGVAAANALANNNEYSVILPMSSVMNDNCDLSDKPKFTFIPIGEGIQTNMVVNRLAAHAFCAKSQVIKEYKFNEQLLSHLEWDLLSRMAIDGVRMICWPEIVIGYPERTAAMLAPKTDAEDKRNIQMIHENMIWTCPGGSGSFSIIDDAKSKGVNHQVLDHNYQIKIQNKTIETTSVSTEIEELYNKSVTRNQKNGLSGIKYLTSKLSQKLYLHIDFFNNDSNIKDYAEIRKGENISIVGWWRTRLPIDKNHNFNLVLRKNSQDINFQTECYKRVDVSMAHHLPTNVDLGFTSGIDTSLVDSGNYIIVGQLYRDNKIILEVKSMRLIIY